jgi:DNA-binding Lrp family transcriptional regulator
MKELRPIDYKILFELIKNSRLSDRKLSEILKVSQPTITRRRALIEKARLIEYTATPDLRKLDFEILAFTFARWKYDKYADKRVRETEAFLEKHPNILFVSTGAGMNWDRICISVHKTYSDYAKFIQELRADWEEYLERPVSFIVSLQSDTLLRNLSFKYLAAVMEKELGSSEQSRTLEYSYA